MPQYHYICSCAPLCLDFDNQGRLIELNWTTKDMLNLEPLSGYWAQQLDAYFGHQPYTFDAPVLAYGTPFQHRVWQAIAQIPYGQVASYGDIARQIGSHPRPVGIACGKNPLPIIIPCHRVVAAQGLGGFSSGWNNRDLAIKRWLLHHEGAQW
ncbi:methylated-DNA--[protein]-cysteine S-methyltransferase [Neisseriaceae bacterium ESL0693]|nr:methylated-DNA--[protein]-cysteine S-methyltransferase [Neisseriaceae bacterium ESL0693]